MYLQALLQCLLLLALSAVLRARKQKTCLPVSNRVKALDQICWGGSPQCIVLKQDDVFSHMGISTFS